MAFCRTVTALGVRRSSIVHRPEPFKAPALLRYPGNARPRDAHPRFRRGAFSLSSSLVERAEETPSGRLRSHPLPRLFHLHRVRNQLLQDRAALLRHHRLHHRLAVRQNRGDFGQHSDHATLRVEVDPLVPALLLALQAARQGPAPRDQPLAVHSAGFLLRAAGGPVFVSSGVPRSDDEDATRALCWEWSLL